jgi:hypothetical protein
VLLVVEALARLGRGQYRGLAGPDQLFGAAHRGGGIHGEAQPGKGPARRIGDWIEITGVGFFDLSMVSAASLRTPSSFTRCWPFGASPIDEGSETHRFDAGNEPSIWVDF